MVSQEFNVTGHDLPSRGLRTAASAITAIKWRAIFGTAMQSKKTVQPCPPEPSNASSAFGRKRFFTASSNAVTAG